MGYWKSKVLPKIKRVFEKNGSKKAAAEACKSFDESKEEINKEFEEKKTELQPEVLKIYEASSTDIKILVKERTKAGIKKHSTLVTKFIDELAKIEFPGSKRISEAVSKLGPGNVSAPVVFIFEKVSALLPAEETSVAATEKEVVITEDDKKAQESVEKIEGKEVDDEETVATPPPAEEKASTTAEAAAAATPA